MSRDEYTRQRLRNMKGRKDEALYKKADGYFTDDQNTDVLKKIQIKFAKTLKGHKMKVFCSDWGGKTRPHTLVSVGQDGNVFIWDAENSVKRSVHGRMDGLKTCCHLEKQDGKRLLLGSLDGKISVYDTDELINESATPLQTYRGHFGYTTCVSYKPKTSNYVISSGIDQVITVFEVNNLIKTQLYGHKADVNWIAFSEADPNMLVSASADNTSKSWDLRINKEVMTYETHEDSVNTVSMFPDAKCFASGSDDKTCRLFDLRACQEVNKYSDPGNLPDPVETTCFSPSGALLFANSGCVALTWAVRSPKNEYQKMGINQQENWHRNEIASMSLHCNGNVIQTSSWDNTIKLWTT